MFRISSLCRSYFSSAAFEGVETHWTRLESFRSCEGDGTMVVVSEIREKKERKLCEA